MTEVTKDTMVSVTIEEIAIMMAASAAKQLHPFDENRSIEVVQERWEEFIPAVVYITEDITRFREDIGV